MLRMITLEMDQIEEIQRELNGGAINLEDIENRQIIAYYIEGDYDFVDYRNWHCCDFNFHFRLDEEDRELEELSYDDLQATTTTETYYPGLPLLAG